MATETLEHRGRRTPPPKQSRGGSAGGGPPAAPAAGGFEATQYPWLVLLGLITAAIMEVLDTTIINVALPQMSGNLNAEPAEIAWVSTGYILSNVIVLPMTAWLSQRFGRKRYLIFSLLLFIGASFFCGTSRSLGELVVWRILQGAGGAALLSTAQATLRQIFPKEQQGLVQAIFVLGIVVAPTIGPTLGGYITDNYNWPWVFFVNIPIGLISVALVYFFLHDPPGQRKAAAIDWAGIGLLAVGLGSLQYVLEEGERNDWFQDALIARLAILAAISLVSLIVWELWPTNKAPIIDFHVLKNKQLTAGLVLFLSLGFGLYGGIFIFPLFAQNILGLTPTATGLVLLPGGLATGVAVVFCGRVLNGKKVMVDPRILITIGIAIFVLSMWMLGHLTTQSGEPDTRLGLIIRGLGLGFLFTPINFIVFASLKGPEIAQGSSFINLARQLGGSFGIAVLNTYITNMTAYHRASIVANIYPGSQEFALRQTSIAQSFVTHGGDNLVHAQAAALYALNTIVQRQAATMAYNNAFILLGVTFALAVPAVFLLRKPRGGGPAAGGH